MSTATSESIEETESKPTQALNLEAGAIQQALQETIRHPIRSSRKASQWNLIYEPIAKNAPRDK